MEDILILVDENDEPRGFMGKEEAHRLGEKHRAFSLLIFNGKHELLLQQRAKHKYHTPGLWSNTCCSHPRQGESLFEAIHRRLPEEMGFDTPMEPLFSVSYRAEFSNGVIENEYDHVFAGSFDGEPAIEPQEVEAYRWISQEALAAEMADEPEKFTPWFHLVMGDPRMTAYWKGRKEKP